MTVTESRRETPGTVPASAGRRRRPGPLQSASLRTLQALLGGALGTLPLEQLFTDSGWIVDAWLTMLIVVAPAALLRLRYRPSALHVLPGLVIALLWLTGRYLGAHAVFGVLPGPGAWHTASGLLTNLHKTINDGVAPVHTDAAVTFVLCASLGLLAALIDLVAVVARRGALAGIPLLVIYTVSGAVPRHPVGWLVFVCAAAGFLLLLGLDANDDLRSWGRFMPRAGATRSGASLGVSAQRIAVAAIAAAVILPLVAPSTPTNLIANAFHHDVGNGQGTGVFGTNNVSLDPFAGLRGTLSKPKSTKLFTVTVTTAPTQPLFYLRANVLVDYTPSGWHAQDHGDTLDADGGDYPVLPTDTGGDVQQATATVAVSSLHDNPPVFGRPNFLTGLPSSCGWSPQDQILVGCTVKHGAKYTETLTQPAPTVAQLKAAPGNYGPELGSLNPFLQTPTMPAQVTTLVTKLTAGITSPYGRALALQDYFTNPTNGFSYSLSTKTGDSGSDLVDFLTNKTGFCQQYAAAMGIMLRMADVPARVVLGYTHPAPSNGSFTVTTSDAHAWVEAYFVGVGWIPFDPTPLAGIDGGTAADLPWATHASAAPAGNPQESINNPHPSAGVTSSAAPSGSTTASAHPAAHLDPWPIVWSVLAALVVIALLLLPAGVRATRRRRRLHAARAGDPDPLWIELSATAVDLGYVWSPARSPRQVVGWLERQSGMSGQSGRRLPGGDEGGSLAGLAAAVEAARYAPDASPADSRALVAALQEAEARLRAGRRRGARVRSRLVPASLGCRWLRIPRITRGRHS